MELKLQTLGPVHIGTGNALEPFEYFIDKGTYYRLNQQKTYELALKYHPDFPGKYSNWIDATAEKLRKAKRDNQLSSEIRLNFNFKHFCLEQLNDPQLFQLVKEKGYAYKLDVPFGLQNKKQVMELIKDANNKFYIPGTSIKGAIRTILAWRSFKIMSKEEKNKVFKKIHNSRGFQRYKGRELDDDLIQEIFICGKRKGGKTSFDDIKYDIMKFIHISDAYPIKIKSAVYPANLYLTDKEPQGQTPALETIDFNSIFKFEISVNEDEIRTIYEKSVKGTDWIGMDKKFKRLFGFYPHEVPSGEMENRIVDSIKTTIDDFSRKIFSRETKWVNDFRTEVLDNGNRENEEIVNIESIDDFYDVYSEIPTKFKIGWASGFISTTIFDALENDLDSKKFLEEIFKRFKIGVPTQKKKNPNINLPRLDKFPKSRRLTAETKKQPIDPFGWVALLSKEETLELE